MSEIKLINHLKNCNSFVDFYDKKDDIIALLEKAYVKKPKKIKINIDEKSKVKIKGDIE